MEIAITLSEGLNIKRDFNKDRLFIFAFLAVEFALCLWYILARSKFILSQIHTLDRYKLLPGALERSWSQQASGGLTQSFEDYYV